MLSYVKTKNIAVFPKLRAIRPLSTPAKGKRGPLTKDEITKGLKENEKFKKYVQSVNSVSPMTVITDYLPKESLAPKNSAEVGMLAETPAEHYNRKVLIEPYQRKSVQQGESKAHQWQISWPTQGRWTNPLMGYSSGADPMAAVKLRFDDREAAIAFAERNGWKYEVKKATSLDCSPPGQFRYDQNFLPEPVRQRLKQEGLKTKVFFNPGYGASNWFMPINFHGTAPVEQHGPSKK